MYIALLTNDVILVDSRVLFCKANTLEILLCDFAADFEVFMSVEKNLKVQY